MAFKLNPAPMFTATINLTIPGQDELGQVKFTFAHKTSEGLKAWLDSAGREKNMTDTKMLSEVVLDWDGVLDDEDKPVPYTKDALSKLLTNYPTASGELVTGYINALGRSRAKN